MKHLNLMSLVALLLFGGIKSNVALADIDPNIATQSTNIQEIDWSQYNQDLSSILSDATNPKKIYLYDIQQKKFITVGGLYGAQPILADMGMFFFIEKVANTDKKEGTGDKYYIHSWVNNNMTSSGDEGTNGDYLGPKPKLDKSERHWLGNEGDNTQKSIKIYVDRGKSNYEDTNTEVSAPERVQWAIETASEGGYMIYSTWKDGDDGDTDERKYYMSYYEGKANHTPQKKFISASTVADKAERFYFISESDYHKAIADTKTKYINVSGLIHDGRFERNNKDITVNLGQDQFRDEFDNYGEGQQIGNAWQFRWNRNEDSYILYGGQDNLEDLSYITACIGPNGNFDGKNGNYIIQKIEGLQPGLYRVNCQGFFFDPDLESKEDEQTEDENYKKENYSFIFASSDIDNLTKQTRLKNISQKDWKQMIDGTYAGKSQTEDGLNGYTGLREKYILNAGKIFADNNPYEDKDVESRNYDNSVAVLVKADKNSTTGTLYIGAGKLNKAGKKGYVLVDNFQLFYMGDKQWYLDAANTSQDEFALATTPNEDQTYSVSGINHNPTVKGDEDKPWTYPVTYNLRRKFNLGKWESLILPCDLNGDQVKQTFGGEKDIKLSVYDNIDDVNINFRSVNPNQEGIKAGKFYIIQVNKEPDIADNTEYTFPWGNETAKVNGPIYQIQGVTPPQFTENAPTETITENNDYTVAFHGFYYDPGSAPKGSYVITKGDMYHIQKETGWASFAGTSWYLTVTDNRTGEAKELNLGFNYEGNGQTTAIKELTYEDTQKAAANNAYVYNLAGQRVAKSDDMSSLKAGIYIVNGKKILIR